MGISAETVEGFTRSLLANRFDSPKPSPEFHKQLWDLCCSEHQFAAIAAPRGTAKSTSVTHSYGLAKACFRESPFTIILSNTEAAAVDFLTDIKIELGENEALRNTFQIDRLEKDSQTELICRTKDGYVFRILAMGAASFKRGIKWRNQRPSLIILDDVEDDEAVLNRDRREKFAKLIDGAIIPSLSDEGLFRMVGTVMHMDSYLENHMPDPRDPECEVTDLSVVRKVPGELWCSAKFRAHTPDFSQLLWPEKLTEQKLKTYRGNYEKRGLLDVYSQEYLNHPIDESAAYFKRDDILDYPRDQHKRPLLPERLRHYAAIDLAISQEARADFTVIAVVGVDERGDWYVVDIRRGRWDALQIIDEMFAVQERYSPEVFTMEGGHIEKSLAPLLKAEMGTQRRRGQFINLNPMTPSKDKQTRARALQARIRAGRVFFDKLAEWYLDLEQEMVRFPKDVHDDQVDALAWIGLTLEKLMQADTQAEWEAEQWESEFGDFAFSGRNMVTGY